MLSFIPEDVLGIKVITFTTGVAIAYAAHSLEFHINSSAQKRRYRIF